MDAKEVMAIVVSLIIIAVGLFTVLTVTSVQETTVSSSYSGYFTITDDSIDQHIDTGQSGMSSITVYQYNGDSWIQVNSSYVSYSNTLVTVQAGGLN